MSKFSRKILAVSIAAIGAFIGTATVVHADDTEIYFAKATVEEDANKPAANVMFLFDTSGSMAGTKISQLKSAFGTVVDGLVPEVSIALARFNNWSSGSSGYGGYVFYPMTPMDTAGRKDEVKTLVNSLPASGNTPTMEAYSEVARYMLGMSPTDYAKNGPAIQNSPAHAVNMNNTPALVDVCVDWNKKGNCVKTEKKWVDVWASNASYTSPINMKNQCESNHIIVMTDGAPTSDGDWSAVSNITGSSCASDNFTETKSFNCQVELAKFLNTDSPNGKKRIQTWQVAFGISKGSTTANRMENVAVAGGSEPTVPKGSQYVRYAENAEELAKAFIDILDLIDEQVRSGAAPGVAVNTLNRFQYLDELYYSVFRPAESSYWEGNLKKYRLVDGEIIDANGAGAVDADKGFFKEDAKSYWSDETDGADVMKGGARNKISATEAGKLRKLLYTSEPGGSLTPLKWTETAHSTTLPNSLFGIEETDDVGNLRRSNVFDKLKNMWGDPLHSVPLMVNYGGSATNNYVFVSNNGGMLHAIDTSDGSEVFAFMPHEFLKQAEKYTTQRPALNEDNTRQTYGLDGSWVAWRKAGATVDAAPEHVYLYGGMRRGGRNYYALDVSSPTAPGMKWQISNSSSGFSELGQTWSTPTVTHVPGVDGAVPAIVFGGGYSPADHDGAYGTRSESDAMGGAVYIVNAETGDLIWKASHADMKWAIPSSIAVVDFNFDGIADFLYFGDLGGQVFRVKLDQTGANDHVTTKIASLGGSGVNHRRFFEAPAISLGREGGKNALYVAIGSGYRAHPLDDDTEEGFFVIRDVSALNPGDTTVATIDNLANVLADADDAPEGAVGWYYLFERDGEKAMATPAIYNNRILFTTYAPTEQKDEDPCSVRYGDAYLHTVYLKTGSPAPLKDVIDLETGEVSNLPLSRSEKLLQSTPAPTPALIIDEHGKTVVVVGTEVVGEAGGLPADLRKRRWMQLPKNEANEIIEKVTK